MPDPTPRLTMNAAHATPGVRLLGSWTAPQLAAPRVWPHLQAALSAQTARPAPPGAWDLRALTRLDHTGAQVLWNAWGRQWPAELLLLDTHRSLLTRVARYSVPTPAPSRSSGWQVLVALGALVWLGLAHLRDVTALMGQLLLDALNLVRAPAKGPWRDVSGHLHHIGATALPITALLGFLIGVVLAYLMAQQLRQFGADPFIVDILGLALIRELGPVLAAILIAGRSGSTITAQIGVMRVTEELDAMRVMGIARGFRLVLPRAIAMAVAMPLLTVWTTVAALLGGMLAAELTMGVSPAYFLAALPDAVQVANLTLALEKSLVFGLLIAVIGCHYGLRVQPNTESLGQGTTAAVVTSITMVVLVDALFAVLFKDVGL
jgi:phospholipid/cholesterol/gamma-HCH transport system permease protein